MNLKKYSKQDIKSLLKEANVKSGMNRQYKVDVQTHTIESNDVEYTVITLTSPERIQDVKSFRYHNDKLVAVVGDVMLHTIHKMEDLLQ